MTSMARASFNQQLQGRELKVSDAQAQSAELGAAAQKADANNDGVVHGWETDQLFLEIDTYDNDGSYQSIRAADASGTPTQAGALASAAVSTSVISLRAPVHTAGSVVTWTPNASALSAAKASGAGRQIENRAGQYKQVYTEAARHTGVPAVLIAALHANESGVGSFRPSTHGPESGFGLDDRWVTTSWGNQQLAKYGLGTWERGTDTPKSRLQSAVVAAEHLKRQGLTAGVTVDDQMSVGEIAGAVTAYIQGGSAGKRAKSRERSWMFDRGDANPHPLHPGGTSRTSRGTVRVPAARKPGLLRWDVLLPLLEERLKR